MHWKWWLTDYRWHWLWILLVLLISTYLKILPNLDNAFPFTTDQGRDMLDVREIATGHNIRLLGPTTSINGVYLGPFYYYLYVIPFWISGGDPAAFVWWNLALFQLTGLGIWLLWKPMHRLFGLSFASLFLLMPVGFVSTRYFWSAHSMVWVMGCYIAILLWAGFKPNRLRLLLVGLISGIGLQSEAALGVLCLPVALGYMILKTKQWRLLLLILLGFSITLVPQSLFEVKNHWPMSNIFFGEVTGNSTILGEALSGADLLHDRWESLLRVIQESHHFRPWIVFMLFWGGILWLFHYLKRKNEPVQSLIHDSLLVCGLWLLAAIILYGLAYHYPLKYWYVLGLSVLACLWITCVLLSVVEKNSSLGLWLLWIVLGLSLLKTTQEQIKYAQLAPQLAQENPSTMRNQLEVIDWVYQRAENRSFSVYSYVPSVYDFTYNYLFWWYGPKKYNYHPEEAAYLPVVPEYILANNHFFSKKLSTEPEELYLIIESEGVGEHKQAWFGNFSKWCVEERATFPWKTQVEKRVKCGTFQLEG